MKAEIKMAACVSAQAAAKNESQNKAYLKTAPLSSLKIEIGEILLSLLAGNTQPDTWQLFDRLLR